jgi:AcrR family transcriptional regulator
VPQHLAIEAPVEQRIRAAAARLLATDPGVSLETITRAAGVSRATFYRYFASRADLLAALDIAPAPDARPRILGAADELMALDGLRGLSMYEVAADAGVSRASVYRLFPGKAALFDGLVAEYSPFDALELVFERLGDEEPAVVVPELLRTLAEIAGPRIGILRALFFEVTAGSPDAVPTANARLGRMLGLVGGYLSRQMELGRLRPMNPLLAAQVIVGPAVFHLVSRLELDRLAAFDVPLENAFDELSRAALRALSASGSPLRQEA